MLEKSVKDPQKSKPRIEMDELRAHVDAYSSFVMANLLWAMLALPLITLPAATVGLMAVMSERVRGKENPLFETFFGAVRSRWRTATVLGLIDLVAGGLIALNVTIFTRMGPSDPMLIVTGAVTMFVGIIVLSANVYAWGIMALDDLPVRRVLEMSMRFALAYPIQTFAILIAAGAVIAVSLLLPRGVLVLVTASAVAYIVAWGSWRVIRRHLSADELDEYLGKR